MAKFVERITAVSLGGGEAETVYTASKPKRKVSRWLKPLEKGHRRMLKALVAYGAELEGRHERSNRKRRNGWLRDAPLNMLRAQREAAKKLFNL
jgi:hypothetical protein